MDRVQANSSRLGVAKAQNTDNSLYYVGEKDKHRDGLREKLVKLVNDKDFDGVIFTHTRLSMLARGFGQKRWPESDRELRLARAVHSRKSPGSIRCVSTTLRHSEEKISELFV